MSFHADFKMHRSKVLCCGSVKKDKSMKNMTQADVFALTPISKPINSVSPLRIKLFSAIFNTICSFTVIPIDRSGQIERKTRVKGIICKSVFKRQLIGCGANFPFSIFPIVSLLNLPEGSCVWGGL